MLKSSVSVYRRADTLFVVTQHASSGGEPSIVAGPLEVLALNVAHEELGAAVFRGLSRTTHNYPYPANQQEWKQVTAATPERRQVQVLVSLRQDCERSSR